jgi:hypothetical protein
MLKALLIQTPVSPPTLCIRRFKGHLDTLAEALSSALPYRLCEQRSDAAITVTSQAVLLHDRRRDVLRKRSPQ